METIKYMRMALQEAKKARDIDEVPVGAVIVKEGKVLARSHNEKETKKDVTKHAEIIAIQKASKKLDNWHLDGCVLYVTLEPCAMCAGAIMQARIKKVVFGAFDPKGGSLESCFQLYNIKGFNHYPEVESGVLEEESAELLRNFFKAKRNV
jgi:Cytosine/adenosine deaminases